MKRIWFGSLVAVLSVGAAGQTRDIIDPSDKLLGSLEVVEPKWGSSDGVAVTPYQLTFRGHKVVAGVARRFPAGESCLELSYSPAFGQQVCGIKIEPQKKTQVLLAGVTISLGAKGSLAVDAGLKPRLTVDQQGRMLWGPAPVSDAEPRRFALLAGGYRFSLNVGVLPSKDLTLTPGQVEKVDLSPQEARGKITVRAPNRLLPNPTPERCEFKFRNFVVLRLQNSGYDIWEPHPYALINGGSRSDRSDGIVGFKALDLARDLELRVFPHTTVDEKRLQLHYAVNNVPVELVVEAPLKEVVVPVHRIDVSHVVVLDEAGEEVQVKGTYRIDHFDESMGKWVRLRTVTAPNADCSGQAILGREAFPTGTGLDVPTGKYKVTVKYQDKAGEQTLGYDVVFSD